jgi:filamentous hemagglutinin
MFSGGLTAAAYTATVVGFTADALAQLVKPDVGQYAVTSTTGLIAESLSDRLPALGPAINETANTFNSSSTGQQVQNSLDKYWSDFANYWSSKR